MAERNSSWVGVFQFSVSVSKMLGASTRHLCIKGFVFEPQQRSQSCFSKVSVIKLPLLLFAGGCMFANITTGIYIYIHIYARVTPIKTRQTLQIDANSRVSKWSCIYIG